jgi:endogenous inhibitor of DNA gyrase (YacG/DUF329 family)
MGQAMLKNCPVCGKPAAEAHRPFCSARCATIDLGRWLGEKYRVETTETADEAATKEKAGDDDEEEQ